MRRTRERGYGQYCGLARALDVIGDRWTLLIVRELLVGSRRFRDLQAGLSGIATNLLTDRLRQLERDGLVERRLAGTPAEGIHYALTGRGRDLRPVVDAIVRWSVPLMASGRGSDAFRAEWLAVALPALIHSAPSRTTRVRLEVCGESLMVDAGPDGTTVAFGKRAAEAVLVAEPAVVLRLAAGVLDLGAAARAGARALGSRPALKRLFARGLSAMQGCRSPRAVPRQNRAAPVVTRDGGARHPKEKRVR